MPKIYKVKLHEIANIKTGLVLSRKRASPMSNFTKKYNTISLKSFNENGFYDHSCLDTFIADEKIKDEYLLKKDDILIRLKEPNIAVCVGKDYGDTIASSLVAIIRTTKNDINPIYLTNYLNSSFAKRQFFKQSSAIPMLNIKTLENLKVILPKKEAQDRIVQIQTLTYKEIDTLKNLIQQKQIYANQIFNNIINQEIKNDQNHTRHHKFSSLESVRYI
ncbi:type I restriction/modification system, specificity subunit [Campylobacter blaseri]|uniref:Restriction endonuclease n=1 Tax=Campylobacter blaseri TaxID=2042961 RepID=A0A2P8QYK4_9BACT|nr:restriction endonuclease subunit S [Campylobacter blaseri]PSM51321.1 restriction endonuclease [Campylobacter blaseri]PSM52465.1 restriction endonuclease [Campylobacter blaseri]QKF86203.1 type I restriction/modification system, specificity subunit [Campylobacter blaseri]